MGNVAERELSGEPLSHCVICGTSLHIHTPDGLTCGYPECREILLRRFRSMMDAGLWEEGLLLRDDLVLAFMHVDLEADLCDLESVEEELSEKNAATFFERVHELFDNLPQDSRAQLLEELLGTARKIQKFLSAARSVVNTLQRVGL